MERKKHHFLFSRKKGKTAKARMILGLQILCLCGLTAAVHAGTMGGFDVSTGTGEFDGEWAGWDDEPSYDSTDQTYNNDYTDEVRNDVQESGASTMNSVPEESAPDSHSNTYEAVNDSYEENTESRSESRADNSKSQEAETPERGNAMPTEAILSSPTDTPTPAPTPTATPTPEATATPAPSFTEVPEAEENKITEYNEEYRLPPAECLEKMKLFYWRKELSGGREAEILLNSRTVYKIMSVRLNGQETDYKTENEKLKISLLSEEKNKIELAVMVPADLPWTENKKNVILAYNIF